MASATPPTSDKGSPRVDRTAAAILDAAAHVFHTEGAGANLAAVATTAGISRATLYRYYANREALLDALTADALAEAAHRIADAGLDRASVEEAIERILRALVAVGDRYAVLTIDHAPLKMAHRQLAPTILGVLSRGVDTGVLRNDLALEVLYEFLANSALTALKLAQQHGFGLEDASATASSFFLNGCRGDARARASDPGPASS